MIVLIEGQCQFEKCTATATHIACGRKYDWDESDVHYHPTPNVYCEKHARVVADEHSPEYIDNCPNCGCMFGVN